MSDPMTSRRTAELTITDVEAVFCRLDEIDAERCDGTQDTLLIFVTASDGTVGVGEVDSAPLVAKAGWPQAVRLNLQWAWADYLALLTALEQRPAAAARLCGYSTATYEMSEERREVNEAAAFDRACRLAASSLGDAEFERLQAEGRLLRDEDIEAIAFGSGDT